MYSFQADAGPAPKNSANMIKAKMRIGLLRANYRRSQNITQLSQLAPRFWNFVGES
jgi:hypothetical protein